MSKFSDEQLKAINSSGNVIVSAGAGSGKTTVLTERVKRNILGETESKIKVSLNELLILTFTKDAAASMKAKIKEKLEGVEELKNLVPLVDSAHIDTFDAYAQFVVTKYGYLENYPSNISIVSDDILSVKCANFIRDILDELYENQDEDIMKFANAYLVKSDDEFFKFLRTIFIDIINKKSDAIEFLTQYKKDVLTKNFFNDLFRECDKKLVEAIKKLSSLTELLLSKGIKEYLLNVINTLSSVDSIEKLIEVKDSLDESKKLSSISKENINITLLTSDDENELIKEIKETYSTILHFASINEKDFNLYDLDNQIEFLNVIVDKIFIPLIKRINEFKFDTGYFTFSDIAKMAISIIKNHDEVREELKNKFKLIMIDEYQDTSYEQEEFINLIANNNVFCVGDIKQSIYRFRGAKPDLFKEKYDAYSAKIGGEAINMNTNYRSRKEILEPINDMFSRLMVDDFGGANYKKDHIINPGNKKYDEAAKTKEINGFSELHNADILGLLSGGEGASKGEKIDAGNAALIALDIKKRIENHYQVYDASKDIVRDAKYSDFTVLTYKTTKFGIYQNVFKQFGIPVNIVFKDSISKDLGVKIIANLLRLLYLLGKKDTSQNETEIKHLYFSILRSHLYEISDSELYEMFKNGDFKGQLIFKHFQELGNKYSNKPMKDVYLSIFKDLPIIESSYKISNVFSGLDKNEILYSKIKSMDLIGYNLNDFSSYFDDIESFDIKMEQSVFSEASDAVTMTTCHASKGLEYPLVYLSQLADFNTGGGKGKNKTYKVIGNYFFLPLFSDAKNSSHFFDIALSDPLDEKEDRAERLRLFYVALTRAKEDIVFVYNSLQPNKEEDKFNLIKEDVTSYFKDGSIIFDAKDVEEFALKRKNFIDFIGFGATFESFLKTSYTNLPLSRYMDKEFEDLRSLLKEYPDEIDEKYEDLYLKALMKEYKTNNYSFSRYLVNPKIIDRFLPFVDIKDNVPLNNGVQVLFQGKKEICGYILKKLILDKTPKDIILTASFSPYIIKKAKIKSVREAKKIIREVSDNDYSSLINLFDLPNPSSSFLTLGNEFKSSTNETLEIIDLHIDKVLATNKKKASKDVDDEVDESSLHFGTHMHALLEIIDLKNPNYDFIKVEKEKVMVKKVIDVLNSINIKEAEVFKEYQFEDEINNTKGVIDLLLIFKDKAVIIDYKLKNIDDAAYDKQLSVYKNYVLSSFNIENIETYLLSIIDAKLENKNLH